MNGRLAGRVAIVTGSSSGIGRGVAHRFAREGAEVVLNSRSPLDVPVRLDGASSDALHVAGDVSDESHARELVAQTIARYGRLDIVVNSAGTTIFVDHDDLDGVTTEDWQRILGVNIIGTWNVIKAARPHLAEHGEGCIINISSMAAIRPAGSSIPYSVSKAGINHMTALLARALGPSIRANAIAPGFIDTPWTKDYLGRRAQVEREAPLRRTGTPEDVADIALALALSPYVTGQIIAVDGGLSLL